MEFRQSRTTSSRILITGGAGFIGSNLVKLLNEFGFLNLVVIDQLARDGKWKIN